jgi:hypothetical protein
MKKRIWRICAMACLGATALLVGNDAGADSPANELDLATGYAAKETCECVFVEGQTDAICTNYGVAPTGEAITMAIDHTANTVTASFVTSKRVASYMSGAGCVLAGLE